MDFLIWLENTSIATFVRESPSMLGFPTFLFVHSLGLSLAVGPCAIVAVRLLGVAPTLPLKPLERLFPYMWIGFWLTVVSGLGLAFADATNKLTNPILLVKLVLVVIAAANMWLLDKKVFRSPEGEVAGNGKLMAGTLLVLWLAVTIAGRLIAYSRTIFEVV